MVSAGHGPRHPVPRPNATLGDRKMTADESAVGSMASQYADKPALRALLQLIPGWGAADSLLQYRVDQIRAARLRAFFDELAVGRIQLSDELVQSEDFLHAFFATIRAALSTRRRDKIRLFSRLLDNSFSPAGRVGSDEYEELLGVLEALSLREFSVLRLLHRFEIEHPRTDNQNELQNVLTYWELFHECAIREYGIEPETFASFMSKLERTGLYLRITGSYLNYEGDKGRTTPLLERLFGLIEKGDAKAL